jgi:hypothetical protein
MKYLYKVSCIFQSIQYKHKQYPDKDHTNVHQGIAE